MFLKKLFMAVGLMFCMGMASAAVLNTRVVSDQPVAVGSEVVVEVKVDDNTTSVTNYALLASWNSDEFSFKTAQSPEIRGLIYTNRDLSNTNVRLAVKYPDGHNVHRFFVTGNSDYQNVVPEPTLLRLTFVPKEEGTYTISLGPDPRSSGALLHTSSVKIPHEANSLVTIEVAGGVEPVEPVDTDGDRYWDDYEIQVGTDPNDKNSKPNLGDVNGDGSVDSVDAMILFNVTVGQSSYPIDTDASDVNLDGNVDTVDAIILFNFFLNNIKTLPLR